MTTDDDVDARLRRFRPVGPSAALRVRCVASPRSPRWPWVAAAALLVAALGTYQASSRVTPRMLRPEPTAATVARMAAWLGGGTDAEQMAAAALARFRADEAARAARPSTTPASLFEEPQ